MTLLLMQYAIIITLFWILVPAAIAAADDPATEPSDPTPAPCSTVRTAMNGTDCPWEQFSELRSGATVDFPPGLFIRTPIHETAASKVLVSDQGEMVVSVWSASTNARLSPREAMATDLYNSGLASVTQRNAGKTDYAFSGSLGSRSLLKRRIFSRSTPGITTTVCVTWPHDAADDWRQLAAAISRSLKPGSDRANSKRSSNQRPEDGIATCLGL